MNRHRALAGRLALVAVLAALLAAPAAAAVQRAPEALIERMQAGGTVIFLRHAATVQSQVDSGRLGDRAGQRNLSETGREQARALGRAFRTLGIRFSRILASPVFRARDTAELAFAPEAVEVTMDIVADDYAGAELERMLEATRRLLRTTPPTGQNLLLVGHRTPLEMVTRRAFPDSLLPEGAMAVFDPDGERLLGTLPADALLLQAAGGD